MKKEQKGFTLIELLVVIAIIGILSSVVLASINSARAKGSDASIKANLSGIRAQAEIVYDSANPQDYATVCANANVLAAITAAKTSAGITAATAVDAEGTPTTATCNDVAGGWAVQVPLKNSGFACVDSSGMSTSTTLNVLRSTDDIDCY